MTPYRKRGSRTWLLTLATGNPARPYVRPSSGTRDKETAHAMQAMLDLFGARGRRWLWVRDAIVSRRLTVPEVYDAYVHGRLEVLEARLADVDLRPLVDAWGVELARAAADGALAEETVRKYRAQVDRLLGDGPVWRSSLTPAGLKAQLEALPGSGTNRRRHAAAWAHWLEYCVQHGALETNPLRALRLPKSNRARERWLDWPVALRLVQAMPAGPHRALAALRFGAGLEMQAALAMRRRDVDLATRVVWAHGRKTASRDRQAIVLDDACWAIVAAYVRDGTFLPEVPLFATTPETHRRAERRAIAELGAAGIAVPAWYTLHAARHTFAVEMFRRGHEAKTIAANLGHANERMVTTLYGKYRPRAADLIASARRAQGGQS